MPERDAMLRERIWWAISDARRAFDDGPTFYAGDVKQDSRGRDINTAIGDASLAVIADDQAQRQVEVERALDELIPAVELRTAVDAVNRYDGDHWDMAVEDARANVIRAAAIPGGAG